jgi:hypothetical protein
MQESVKGEACVLLLDTGVEGWPVVYANESWRVWAGYDRDEAVGKPLAQLIVPAGSGRPQVDWGDLQRAASDGGRFVLHCMRVADRPLRDAVMPAEGPNTAADAAGWAVTGQSATARATPTSSLAARADSAVNDSSIVASDAAQQPKAAGGAAHADSSATSISGSSGIAPPVVQQPGKTTCTAAASESVRVGCGTSSLVQHPGSGTPSSALEQFSGGWDAAHDAHTFDISFRPASRDLLDQDTLPIGACHT